MNIYRYLLTSLFVCLVSFNLSAQDKPEYKEEYYKPDAAKFEQFINAAYGDRADELVFQDQIKYLIMKDFFENRLIIVDRNPNVKIPDSFTQLSEIGTYNYATVPSYNNANLNPKTFNPFYYKINYTKNTEKPAYYHISGTHYYLKVAPFDVNEINKLRQE